MRQETNKEKVLRRYMKMQAHEIVTETGLTKNQVDVIINAASHMDIMKYSLNITDPQDIQQPESFHSVHGLSASEMEIYNTL